MAACPRQDGSIRRETTQRTRWRPSGRARTIWWSGASASPAATITSSGPSASARMEPSSTIRRNESEASAARYRNGPTRTARWRSRGNGIPGSTRAWSGSRDGARRRGRKGLTVGALASRRLARQDALLLTIQGHDAARYLALRHRKLVNGGLHRGNSSEVPGLRSSLWNEEATKEARRA